MHSNGPSPLYAALSLRKACVTCCEDFCYRLAVGAKSARTTADGNEETPRIGRYPPEVEELSRQIEQWRSNRPRIIAMPEPPWTEEASFAKQYSPARIARLLRLDYYTVNARMECLGRDGSAVMERKMTFIELQALAGRQVSECIIDVEHPRGSSSLW
jgi:hypothetical protein